MTDAIANRDITALAAAYRSRNLSPVEVVDTLLRVTQQVDPKVNAYVEVLREQAMRDAEAAERDFRRNVDRGILQGIPVAVKDNIDVAGVTTTLCVPDLARRGPRRRMRTLFNYYAVLAR